MREGESMDRRQVDKERAGTLKDVINKYIGYIDRRVPLTQEEELDRDLAELDRKLEERRQRKKTEAELFATMGDYPRHPMESVFESVIEQATKGKGDRHGGERILFLEQPWMHYAKMNGRGFLTGQAAKKLEEAASIRNGEAFIHEMEGAITYCAMSILFEKERMENE